MTDRDQSSTRARQSHEQRRVQTISVNGTYALLAGSGVDQVLVTLPVHMVHHDHESCGCAKSNKIALSE